MQKYIKIEEGTLDHAERAYEKGFYIEAAITLHASIEFYLRSYLMLVGAVHFDTKLAETWDKTDEYFKFGTIVMTLYVLGHLKKDEWQDLMQINTWRNKLAHEVFIEPYQKKWLGYEKSEYDRIYKLAQKWENKSEEMNSNITVSPMMPKV